MRSTLILLISLLFWTHSLVQPVFSQTITSSSGEGTQVETSESAETEEQAPEESIAEPETWGGVLDSTEQALTREGLTDEELDQLLGEISKVEFASRQASINFFR